MENYNVKAIVDSLFDDNPNEEYINLYLNDDDLRKQCNKVISERLHEDFSNTRYDIDGCLNFLNNVISRELDKKPYLLELNVIINTINEHIDKNKSMIYFAKMRYESFHFLLAENEILTKILFTISENFTLKYDINYEAEKKLGEYYKYEIENDLPLTEEEVEELLSFYLTSGFAIYDEEYNMKVLDYALKNVLEFDYKISDFLYKKLFMYTCKNELKKRNINDMDFVFSYSEDSDDIMSFNPNDNTIIVNNNYLLKYSMLENIISFFHELRHYEQRNGKLPVSLAMLLCEKDRYLTNALSEEYYNSNYSSLFFEEDAKISSYEQTHEFVKEKAPNCLPNAREAIYNSAVNHLRSMSDSTYRRSLKKEDKTEYEDLDVLFEETVRENKDLSYKALIGCVNNILLIEYDLSSNKRNIFELLKIKDGYIRNNFNEEEVKIINYLLYEENVSFEYILENLKLFYDENNRRNYKEYYKEAKDVLKQKIITYCTNKLGNKRKKASDDEKYLLSSFYGEALEELKKLNIIRLRKNKNIELYRRKEKELMESYKWLYSFINEIEDEHVETIESGKMV